MQHLPVCRRVFVRVTKDVEEKVCVEDLEGRLTKMTVESKDGLQCDWTICVNQDARSLIKFSLP
jgi:hypothetical protein